MKSTVSYFNRVSSLQELGRIIPLLVLSASGLLLSSASYASDPFERDGERAKGTFVEAANASGTVLSVGWNGLNIGFPHEIQWTSSKVTVRDAEKRACVAVGSDDRGPVELILVELNGYFAATFTDGSGVRWSARNTVGQPIVFIQVAAKDADFPEKRSRLRPNFSIVGRNNRLQDKPAMKAVSQEIALIQRLLMYWSCTHPARCFRAAVWDNSWLTSSSGRQLPTLPLPTVRSTHNPRLVKFESLQFSQLQTIPSIAVQAKLDASQTLPMQSAERMENLAMISPPSATSILRSAEQSDKCVTITVRTL